VRRFVQISLIGILLIFPDLAVFVHCGRLASMRDTLSKYDVSYSHHPLVTLHWREWRKSI